MFPDEIQTIVDWHDTMVQTENRDESLAAQLHEMEMIFRAMRDLKIRIDSASMMCRQRGFLTYLLISTNG